MLTDAEINDLTGDDVAYWLSNPFVDRESIAEKVRWWISQAVEATRADMRSTTDLTLRHGEAATQ